MTMPDQPGAPEAAERRDLTAILSGGRDLPDGYDTWGWKAVRPDLRTRGGYRWPWPGGEAVCPDPAPASAGPCAAGLHIALRPSAAAYPMVTLLLLAYRTADVITADDEKRRVSRALVVDVIDLAAVARDGRLAGADLAGANLSGADLSRAYLAGADLAGADLSGADLSRADLAGADLSRANLSGADLSRAYLTRAYLSRAYLTRAYLSGADLSDADLAGADLSRAYLSGADLSRAYLAGAYLSRANLTGANLARANLTGADLSRANLSRADLTGAITGTPNWMEGRR